MRRRRDPVSLDDDLDLDSVPDVTELGIPFDLARDDLADDEDGIGLRALFEHPENVIRTRWHDAA